MGMVFRFRMLTIECSKQGCHANNAKKSENKQTNSCHGTHVYVVQTRYLQQRVMLKLNKQKLCTSKLLDLDLEKTRRSVNLISLE